jgi:hypothetical protein
LSEQGDLHICRPCVALVQLELFDRLRFDFHSLSFLSRVFKGQSVVIKKGNVKPFPEAFWLVSAWIMGVV